MPTEPPAIEEKSRHRDRKTKKGTGTAKDVMRASHPRSSAHSSKNSLEEISRLKEVIAQLQEGQVNPTETEDFKITSELRWKINQLQNEKLQLTAKYNEEVSAYASQVARLRAAVERGEAQRQTVEYEVALTRKNAAAQENSAEEKIASLHIQNQHLQVLSAELRQRASDLERALEITRQARDEDQQGLQMELNERDRMLISANAENDLLTAEKGRLEALLQAIEATVAPMQNKYLETEEIHIKDVRQEQDDTLQKLRGKLERVEKERERQAEAVERQVAELSCGSEREERLRKELEAVLQRVKTLEESVESERAAHLESKFNSEIIQLRIRDLGAALSVEKSGQAEARSSLELMRQQFREVERAYNNERGEAKDTREKLSLVEGEYMSVKADLTAQLEREKALSTELAVKLQEQERWQAKSQQELSLAKKKQEVLEEAYESWTRELGHLLQQHQHQGVLHTPTTGHSENCVTGEESERGVSALIDVLRRTLGLYQSTLEQTTAQLQELVQEKDEFSKESRERGKTICDLRRDLQEAEARVARVGEEGIRLRSGVADAAAAADRLQAELRAVTQRWEGEKNHSAQLDKQLDTLTQQHHRDSQEKLTFLHSLYQRLVAGCVLVAPPQVLLGSFTWPELCAVLQEHVDALTSDLNAANQKISCLEGVCEAKAHALQELQRVQQGALQGLATQLKQREQSWQAQREQELRQHKEHTRQLHSKAQAWRERCEQAEGRACGTERARAELDREAARLQELLGACRRDDASLLAACALLAGCVSALRGQVRALAWQKAALLERGRDAEALEREVGTLLDALRTEPEVKGQRRGRGVWAFRRCVVAVLAALRLRALGRRSTVVFRLSHGLAETPAVYVRALRCGEEEEGEDGDGRLARLVRSPELSILIHSCMKRLQQELDSKDSISDSSSPGVLAAAQSGFSKLLVRLVAEEDYALRGHQGDKGSLARRLGQGLHRLRAIKLVPSSQYTNQCLVASLQQHILAFTQRLHAAEVERRGLRVELSRLKRSAVRPSKRAGDPEHTACVPAERFEGLLAELSCALQREAQAQALLREQATQLQDLGLTMEQRSGDELEKDQTLAQAVKSLTEAQVELRRKDQYLRSLGKHLSQSQQEKQQLQGSISSAENALRMAAKSKDALVSYMRSVEGSLMEVKGRIVLSQSSTSRDDFTLQLPKMHLETPGPERLMGGPEVAVCQDLVQSFLEVYQLACAKMASLEKDILCHQRHTAALKTELQDACLRENQCFVPVIGSADSQSPFERAEMDCGKSPILDPGVPLEDVPGNKHPTPPASSLSAPLKKTRGQKKGRKNSCPPPAAPKR